MLACLFVSRPYGFVYLIKDIRLGGSVSNSTNLNPTQISLSFWIYN